MYIYIYVYRYTYTWFLYKIYYAIIFHLFSDAFFHVYF